MGRLCDNRIRMISWDSVMAFLLGFICLGGATFFPHNLRWPFMVLAVAGTAMFTGKLYVTRYQAMWFAIAAVLVVAIPFSYDKGMAAVFAGLYFLSAVLLCFPYTDHFWERLLTVMRGFALVMAISIILSTVIENLILDYFWIIVNPRRTQSVITRIQNELSKGSYSGLAGEQAQAALIMNVGIATKLAIPFSGGRVRKKDSFELVLYLVALILTGKRMLFVIPVLVGATVLLLSEMRQKVTKLFFAILGLVAALGVAYFFIPQMAIIYERLIGNVGTEYYDPLSGRGDLWEYSIRMFLEKPLFGYGFGSYNSYAYDHGYLRNGQRWNYFGHNCYLQLLGETGLVGTALFVGMFVYALVFTARSFRKSASRERKYYLIFSFCLQLMLLIYCVTGNVLYYAEQVFLWFIGIAMSFYMENREMGRTWT